MAVFVTGGAGYIGSHCVRQLKAAGHHPVIVVDNLSTGRAELLGSDAFIKADVRDRSRMAELMRAFEVKAVLHFAASAYVGESVYDPAKYYDNNVVGTLQLLNAMRDAHVSRIIFSSSCAVYGVPHRLPLDEAMSVQPVNPYGFTKLVVERMLAEFDAAYGIRSVALRYFNAAGAHPSGELGEWHEPETHLIPLALQAAAGTGPALTLLGSDYPTSDGTCVRDFVHVVDIAEAHRLALDYLLEGGSTDIFNIGIGQGYSVRQVVAACERVTGKSCPVVAGPRRPGDPPELIARPEKLVRRLGWEPRYPDLQQMVATAWQWESTRTKTFMPH
jgi:UDP-glucose-4-epimerase GalE